MGRSRSAAEFSGKIHKMATATQKRQRLALEQGALVTKELMVAEAAAAGVRSSTRIHGAKWGVRYTITGFDNPSALVRYFGPFHLVDNPTKAHEIPRARRGRTAKRLLLPDGGVRASVEHPGTRGKHTFPKAKHKAQVAAPRVMAKPIVSGWAEALR